MSELVTHRDFKARIWPCADGLYRWHYWDKGRRKTASRVDLESAKKAALDQLKDLAAGIDIRARVTPVEASLFAEWSAARKKAPITSAVLSEFLTTKKRDKLSDRYSRGLRDDLQTFCEAFPRSIDSISADEITAYLTGLKVGPRRENNVRSYIVTLFRFARDRGHLPDKKTAPEMVAKAKEHKDTVTVYTPVEFRTLLKMASDDWKVPFAIAGLSGIRSDEIGRMTWGMVKLKKGHIDLPANITKTGHRRLVPICDALKEWLTGENGQLEKICPAERWDRETARIKAAGFIWKINALRHSYGSYRAAATADLPRVAYEMGNSVEMIKRHYHEAQDLETALDWFATTPEKVRLQKVA